MALFNARQESLERPVGKEEGCSKGLEPEAYFDAVLIVTASSCCIKPRES